jgi:hypothetical protein
MLTLTYHKLAPVRLASIATVSSVIGYTCVERCAVSLGVAEKASGDEKFMHKTFKGACLLWGGKAYQDLVTLWDVGITG